MLDNSTASQAEIVAREAGIERAVAEKLVAIGQRSRNLKGHGLDEGASTRMLIQAGRLIAHGVSIKAACQVALVLPITDGAHGGNNRVHQTTRGSKTGSCARRPFSSFAERRRAAS